MEALDIFAKALEAATGQEYVTNIVYQPLLLPAYKEFTFTLRTLRKDVVYEGKYTERVTNESEKQEALRKCAEKFIAYVLKTVLNKE